MEPVLSSIRHRPACPGDPFSFFPEGNWIARMKRAMANGFEPY
jgi:hypothetical protein